MLLLSIFERNGFMEREQEILQVVKEKMPEKRYIHTLGVRDTAVLLAKRYV